MSGNERTPIKWPGIVFGVIWLLMAILIFVLYQTGNLDSSFRIPRVLAIVYNTLGIVAGSIVQFIFSIFLIISSLPKKK